MIAYLKCYEQERGVVMHTMHVPVPGPKAGNQTDSLSKCPPISPSKYCIQNMLQVHVQCCKSVITPGINTVKTLASATLLKERSNSYSFEGVPRAGQI